METNLSFFKKKVLEKELELVTKELNESRNLIAALRLENEDAMVIKSFDIIR